MNYPIIRKSRKPWLQEPKVKCPECDYYSIEKVTKAHYERWHILPVLRQLIFDNPCIGCQENHKTIKKLHWEDYSKLCMTHRQIYDDFIITLQSNCEDKS